MLLHATRGADKTSTRACRVEFGALLAESPGLPRDVHAGCGVVARTCMSRGSAAAVWVQQRKECTQRACPTLPVSRPNSRAPVCQAALAAPTTCTTGCSASTQLTNAVLHVELRGQLRAAVGYAAACRLAALAALAREQLLLIQLSRLRLRLLRTIGSACTGAAVGAAAQTPGCLCEQGAAADAAAAARPGI